jgi:hypothetical protein
VGQRGNELAGKLAKDAASNKNEHECYNWFPKIAVISDLNEQSKTVAKGMGTNHKRGNNEIFFPQTSRHDEADNQCTPQFYHDSNRSQKH